MREAAARSLELVTEMLADMAAVRRSQRAMHVSLDSMERHAAASGAELGRIRCAVAEIRHDLAGIKERLGVPAE